MISTLTVITPSPTQDLTLLATAKRELGTADVDDDDLAEIIRQASDAISGFCNLDRGFGRETVAETFIGVGARVLILSGTIAVSVSSVVVDGATLDVEDYVAEASGLLYRLRNGYPAPWSARKIVVTYQTGFTLLTDLPRDIERACLDLVTAVWAARGRDRSIRSYESPDVETITYMDADKIVMKSGLPADIATRLDQYRVPRL